MRIEQNKKDFQGGEMKRTPEKLLKIKKVKELITAKQAARTGLIARHNYKRR